MSSAAAVADTLRAFCGRGIGAVKLHKLLYYCQAWHVVWTGEPLFGERIEAWGMGPVVADLWRDEHNGLDPGELPPLTADERRTVGYVVARYGDRGGNALAGATHQEAPWRQACKRGQNAEISVAALAEFFAEDEAADQAWFWDDEWQAGEREATDDIAAGRTTGHRSVDDFIASL